MENERDRAVDVPPHLDAGERQLLEMIASGRSLRDVLNAVCALFESIAPDHACGVYPIDWSGPTFRDAVAPSLPASYLAPVEGLPVEPGVAPCGIAACSRVQVIVEDIAADPRWNATPYCAHVLAHGLRSVWSTPIATRDGDVLGTFCIYRREAGAPSPRECKLIDQITHLACIALDRERRETALRRSEAFLAQAQRLTKTGSIWWKPSTGQIVWSEENYRILDYPPTVTPTVELAMSRCHPDDRLDLQIALTAALSAGTPVDLEHRLLMPDGTVKHVRVFFQNVALDHLPTEFVGAVTDITEWKEAAEQLKQSEAHLAEAQRLNRTGSFTWRSVTNDRKWSDEMCRIYGFERATSPTVDEVMARIYPPDLALFRDLAERSQAGEDTDDEFRLLMPDGSLKHVHVVSHGVRDRDGHLQVIGAMQDVTQQRHSEEALGELRSQLAYVARTMSLGTLTASIAHELNQPLAGVVTNASTCLRMLDGDPPNVVGARATARRMIRDGNRAAGMIARLRALFSGATPTLEPVDLNRAATDVVALTRSELQRGRAAVRLELAEGLPLVMGDRVQLQQVVLNLIRNALEAMSDVQDRDREIVIRTTYGDDDRICLSVRDAGVGIDPNAADRLFDAFFTTKPQGMGIGLSVSRSIIESHLGQLRASTNEGPGATFEFSVPRRAARARRS